TNPMMRLCDLRAPAATAEPPGVSVCVDHTFAPPYNQRPLDLGAHVVVHSSPKDLNGPSDVIGCIPVTNDDGIADARHSAQEASGAAPGPFDCWLVLRGTKTRHLRMEAHNRKGQRIAEFLAGHDGVEAVHYPGLPTHPQHELAKRQMRGFTGMISLELGSLERAKQVVERKIGRAHV